MSASQDVLAACAAPADPLPVRLAGVDVAFPASDRPGQSQLVMSDMSREVPQGQFLVLIGRSGCGKTTILNVHRWSGAAI